VKKQLADAQTKAAGRCTNKSSWQMHKQKILLHFVVHNFWLQVF